MRELALRCMADNQERAAASAAASLAANAMIGFGKLALGIYLLSPWFMANAVYYLLLCASRWQTLGRRRAAQNAENENERQPMELHAYRRGGVFISLMGLAYLLVCLQMFFAGDSTVYRGDVLIYGTAAASFVKMGFAIYGAATVRRVKSPIFSLLKIISFTDASVSIVVTQCTMLTMQGVENAAGYSAITGMVFSAVSIIRGLHMLSVGEGRPASPK